MTAANELQVWIDAVNLHDEGDLEQSTRLFASLPPSAKFLFNIAMQHYIKGDFTAACSDFNEALKRDQYLALCSFMLANCYLLQKRNASAFKEFSRTVQLMRGSSVVDYKQLGAEYKLYQCEVLLNHSVAAMKMDRVEVASNLLLNALQCSCNGRTELIKSAINTLQNGHCVECIQVPSYAIFRPTKHAVSNLNKKNYLGESKVLASSSFSSNGGSNRPVVKSRRDRLMADIKRPDIRATLKRPRARPDKPLPMLPEDQPRHRSPPTKTLPPPPAVLPEPRMPSSRARRRSPNPSLQSRKDLPPVPGRPVAQPRCRDGAVDTGTSGSNGSASEDRLVAQPVTIQLVVDQSMTVDIAAGFDDFVARVRDLVISSSLVLESCDDSSRRVALDKHNFSKMIASSIGDTAISVRFISSSLPRDSGRR